MKGTIKKRIGKTVLAGVLLVSGALGVACKSDVPDGETTVYMPDGAPALALAKLMHEDKLNDGVSYYVVDAKAIASKVSYKDLEKNADLCVLPVSAASKLLGNGENYKMLGLVTQGNLFLLSKTETVEYTAQNLNGLLGKTVVVAQMNEVPGLTLKATLTANGIAWQELKEGVEASADKVNLTVSAAEYDVELVAEPAVSKRLAASAAWRVVGDLQKLYGAELGGNYGFPQAALVVKASLLETHENWVKEFVEEVASGSEWLAGANASEVYEAVVSHFEDKGKAPVFSAETLGADTLARCGVRFTYASACKNVVNSYLQGLIGVNASAAKVPADAFYWEEE